MDDFSKRRYDKKTREMFGISKERFEKIESLRKKTDEFVTGLRVQGYDWLDIGAGFEAHAETMKWMLLDGKLTAADLILVTGPE